MTFKYRSPADLSINIGGLGWFVSYVTPQQNCPAAGTFIRYNDTSRYEYDVVNQQFWMPYNTEVLTDGNCGEMLGSEIWGLQYLPAGWVTASSLVDKYVYPYGSSNFVVGVDEVRSVEDGTGINNTMPYQSISRVADGTWLMWVENSSPYEGVTSYYDYYTSNTVMVNQGVYLQNAYLYDAPSDNYRTGPYLYSGTYYPDTTYIADQPDSSVEVPSGSGNYFFDGNDNRYEWDGNGNAVFRYSGLYGYGTYIYQYGDYNYYWDGSAGYYSEYVGSPYPPYGTILDSGGSSSQLTWYSPDGNSGTWTYSSSGYTTYADGNGGSWTDSGGWSANYGEYITSGSYSYDTGSTDEWGNPVYANGSYSICYDGNGGYYTNYS